MIALGPVWSKEESKCLVGMLGLWQNFNSHTLLLNTQQIRVVHSTPSITEESDFLFYGARVHWTKTVQNLLMKLSYNTEI